MKRSTLAALSLGLVTLAPCTSPADDRVYSNLTFDPTVLNGSAKWTNVGVVFVVEASMDDACGGVPKVKRINLSDRSEFLVTERSGDLWQLGPAVGKDGSIAYSERSPEFDLFDACTSSPSHVYYTPAGTTDRVHIYDGDRYRHQDPFGNSRLVRDVHITDDGYIAWEALHVEYNAELTESVIVQTLYEYQIPFDGVVRTSDFENVKGRGRFEKPGGTNGGVHLNGILSNRNLVITLYEETGTEFISSIALWSPDGELSVIAKEIDPDKGDSLWFEVAVGGVSGDSIFYDRRVSSLVSSSSEAHVWRDGATYVFDGPVAGSSNVGQAFNYGVSGAGEALVYLFDIVTGMQLGIFKWDGVVINELPNAVSASLDDLGNVIYRDGDRNVFIRKSTGGIERLDPRLPDGQLATSARLANDGTVFIQHFSSEAYAPLDFAARYKSFDLVVGQFPAQGCQDLDDLRQLVSELLVDSVVRVGLLKKLNTIEALQSGMAGARGMGPKKLLDAFVKQVSAHSFNKLSEGDAEALRRCAVRTMSSRSPESQ